MHWPLSPRARRILEIALVVLLLLAGLALRVRLNRDWAFVGADSVGYMKLARELVIHGRYALGPLPEPLAWVRPPLYPLFLALTVPSLEIGRSWGALIPTQIALDLATALLCFGMARRLAGPVAGLLALALAALNPFTSLFTAAMLTETLATFLSTATLAAVVLGAARPLVWWPLGGALVALSSLLRPDGLMLATAFGPALWFLPAPRRRKLTLAALTLASFTVVFAPWPARNLMRFGQARPLGGRIDRYTRPVENYAGYWAWLRSWSRDWISMTTPTTCYYDSSCPAALGSLRERGAYVDLDDAAEVERLIAQRFAEGLTPAVDAGFQRLADRRRRAHPLLVELGLPLSRAWLMWAAPHDELLQARLPWPSVWRVIHPRQRAIATVQWILILAAGAWLVARRRTRVDASSLYATLIVRTLVLGYTFYCMPRYALEVMPLGWTLAAAGLVEAWRSWRARRKPVGSS